ncbi:MAG: DUF6370 family protein [Pedobacter sp.]|nr:DUF6370 family protein [Pedobacter sp.]MDQ8053520.1 DUF6370 family protein [Pedobacter sp.]
MRKLAIILFFSACGLIANAQENKQELGKKLNKQVVEIACGECKFKMSQRDANGKGKSCDLAIRMDGKTYFVDGKTVDDFGDAHAEHGFCNAISKAEVTGEIVNNRFKAKTITLIPEKSKKLKVKS